MLAEGGVNERRAGGGTASAAWLLPVCSAAAGRAAPAGRTLVEDGSHHLRVAKRFKLLLQPRQAELLRGDVQPAQPLPHRLQLLAAQQQLLLVRLPLRGAAPACRGSILEGRRGRHLRRHGPTAGAAAAAAVVGARPGAVVAASEGCAGARDVPKRLGEARGTRESSASSFRRRLRCSWLHNGDVSSPGAIAGEQGCPGDEPQLPVDRACWGLWAALGCVGAGLHCTRSLGLMPAQHGSRPDECRRPPPLGSAETRALATGRPPRVTVFRNRESQKTSAVRLNDVLGQCRLSPSSSSVWRHNAQPDARRSPAPGSERWAALCHRPATSASRSRTPQLPSQLGAASCLAGDSAASST